MYLYTLLPDLLPNVVKGQVPHYDNVVKLILIWIRFFFKLIQGKSLIYPKFKSGEVRNFYMKNMQETIVLFFY